MLRQGLLTTVRIEWIVYAIDGTPNTSMLKTQSHANLEMQGHLDH